MIYFTSDLHIGHANIIHLASRPFKDIIHSNETIISNYRAVVNECDTVYFVGDIAWQFQDLPGILSRLPGNKILVVGNHDKCAKELWAHSPSKYVDFYLRAGFGAVLTHAMLTIANHQVMLSHFPYKGDPQERYHDKRLEDRGHWLISGHVHNSWLMRGKNINVSVEMWNYKPVSARCIEEIINSQGVILAYPGWCELNEAMLAGEYPPKHDNENDFHSQFDDTSTISLQNVTLNCNNSLENVTFRHNPLQSGEREGEPD